MVSTSVWHPTGILKDYVRSFELREFDTGQGEMAKAINAYHEVLMSFFIDCQPKSFQGHDKFSKDLTLTVKQPYAGIMGIQSSMKGSLIFQGHVRVFNIQFKPMGFSRIFGMPPSDLSDQAYELNIIFKNDLEQMHSQLHESISFLNMVEHAEKFLAEKLDLNKTRVCDNNLFKAADYLLNHTGHISIEQLAYHTNIGLKTLERKFIQQVGISPKLYTKILRFNRALELKMNNPTRKWTQISYDLGYYDQNHFIKDFKAFAGQPPTGFFKHTPPPQENVTKY